jgi:hypothetical protein
MLYRCGTKGKRYLTKHGAYMAEAARIFYAAYPDGGKHVARLNAAADADVAWDPALPELEDEATWYAAEQRDKRIVCRLARWLRWRDGRRLAIRGECCGGMAR